MLLIFVPITDNDTDICDKSTSYRFDISPSLVIASKTGVGLVRVQLIGFRRNVIINLAVINNVGAWVAMEVVCHYGMALIESFIVYRFQMVYYRLQLHISVKSINFYIRIQELP